MAIAGKRKKREAPAQERLLEFIRDYKQTPDADGNSPTYEDCAEALGLSVSTIYTTASRMIRRGILRMNSKGKLVLGGRYIPPDPTEDDLE